MPLVLKATELASMIDMAKAVEITEDVLKELARGRVEVHAPYHLAVPGGAMRVVSAALQETGTMGVRYGPALNLEPPSGYRSHIASLYGIDGDLLAVMGYPFSQLRTGATVAVAVKHMAKPGASNVGLIGTGQNALSLIEGAKAVRPLKQVAVYSRDPERRKRFAAEAAKATGVPVHAVASTHEAISGRDIVLTSTNFRQPLFEPDELAPGCLVASMGPIGELSENLFLKAGHIVVSCIQQERDYFTPQKPFPLVDLINEGRLSWNDVDQLGDLLLGKAKARKANGGALVFHESAGGFGDMAFATYAYEQARDRGLGLEVSF